MPTLLCPSNPTRVEMLAQAWRESLMAHVCMSASAHVCVCVCVAQGPRIRWPRKKPRLEFLGEGIFSVSCLPASCLLYFSGTSFPSFQRKALKIPPKFVPREPASQTKRFWKTKKLNGVGFVCFF